MRTSPRLDTRLDTFRTSPRTSPSFAEMHHLQWPPRLLRLVAVCCARQARARMLAGFIVRLPNGLIDICGCTAPHVSQHYMEASGSSWCRPWMKQMAGCELVWSRCVCGCVRRRWVRAGRWWERNRRWSEGKMRERGADPIPDAIPSGKILRYYVAALDYR